MPADHDRAATALLSDLQGSAWGDGADLRDYTRLRARRGPRDHYPQPSRLSRPVWRPARVAERGAPQLQPRVAPRPAAFEHASCLGREGYVRFPHWRIRWRLGRAGGEGSVWRYGAHLARGAPPRLPVPVYRV